MQACRKSVQDVEEDRANTERSYGNERFDKLMLVRLCWQTTKAEGCKYRVSCLGS